MNDTISFINVEDFYEMIITKGLEGACKDLYLVESRYKVNDALCFELSSVKKYTIEELIKAFSDKDYALAYAPDFSKMDSLKGEK